MDNTYTTQLNKGFEREEEERRKELLLIEADEYESFMNDILSTSMQ